MSIIIIVHKFHYSGSKIFSTFIGFLKSKDPSDGTEEALLNELTSFDSYLKDNVSGLVAIVMLHEWFIIAQLFCMSCNISIISSAPFLSYLRTCLDSCTYLSYLHQLVHI